MVTTENKKLLTQNRFKLTIAVMRCGGIPIFMEKKSLLYLIFEVVSYCCTFITVIASWLDVFIGKHELKEVLAALRISMGMLIIMWVNVCFRTQMKSMEVLLRFTEVFTWEEMTKKDILTGKLTSVGYLPVLDKGLKYMMGANVIFHVIQSGYRIITQRDTIYPTWYPYDFKVSPAYELTNLSQVLTTIQLTGSFYSFVGLFASVVIVGCSQFDKLKMSFKGIMEESSLSNFNQQQLNNCIMHHQQILQYLTQIEDKLNICICGLLFLQMASCCLSAFSIIISWGDYADMSQSALLYFVWMATICSVCWAGDELTQRAESIKNTVYEKEWIGAPISFQKSIMIIITRTNAMFTLTAGKFMSISNRTMMSILNETLSLFMFLLEMKDKNTKAEY